MDIEEHFRNVDWNRVKEKSEGMDRAKRGIMNVVSVLIPFLAISMNNILSRFEDFELSFSGFSSLRAVFRILPFVMLIPLAYSVYNYFKWSSYPVMRDINEG